MARGGGTLSKLVAVEGEARRLDRFELVAELATGGMATVFLARLSGVGGFQRFVAIKRLHPHLAREPEFIEMFLEEARLSARIHHPNVVPILEIGESDQGYYIVMEYVEGDTLGRLLARSAQTGTRLPTKVGLRVIIDMLAGLDAAHELKDDDGNPFGVVHRDISPQNVLVGVDGSSRLSDFGVARATSKLSTTRTGQLKGKLAYMAPEQAKGTKDIDRRADLFASGIVLWEVLACRRLFKGDGEADTLNRVLHEPIPPVRSAAPTIPAALEAVVAKALERERTKRYATAAEFAEALERASRVVGSLGTHKDVAQYLEAVLGTEISQQREVVRAWLARSEPSRHGIEGLQRPDTTTVTRVESKEGTPSGVSRVSGVSQAAGTTSQPSMPSQPSMRSQPSVPSQPSMRSQPSMPSQPSQPSVPSTPSAVGSSEAGAVALAEEAPASSPAGKRKGARVWPWVALLVVGLGGGGAYMHYVRGFDFNVTSTPAAPPQPAVTVAAAPPPAMATAAAPAPPSTASTPPASATSAATAAEPTAAAPTKTAAAPPPRWGTWRAARPAPAPTQSPTAAPAPAPAPAPTVPAAVPDDISRNPYR